MALTSGFVNGQGTPDKHIMGGGNSSFPSFPADDDSNASGEVPDVSGGEPDGKARAIFGTAGAPAAPRVAGVAAEAEAAGGAGGGKYNIESAFIDASTPTTVQYGK